MLVFSIKGNGEEDGEDDGEDDDTNPCQPLLPTIYLMVFDKIGELGVSKGVT